VDIYKERVRVEISGRVQGVGFRPTVYKYAVERNLNGFVRNTPEGVLIEIEGDSGTLKDFISEIRAFPPGQAKIKDISVSPVPFKNEKEFKILQSKPLSDVKVESYGQSSQHQCLLHPPQFARGERRHVEISPDIATCTKCIEELFNPENRRYLYPFINCINCGPRFTIIGNIPYDRRNTTMNKFTMCDICRKEYENPLNRRFHTQPNCCFECGPTVKLINENLETEGENTEGIKKVVKLLEEGKIIAIKGLGGFHLSCDAKNEKAIKKLRKRKKREAKPFALMAKDIETIKKFCHMSSDEKALLTSFISPVVLLEKNNSSLPEEIAPANKYLGFMLPYTGLHHLIFKLAKNLEVLVMTSGNFSEEPIIYENEIAFTKLGKIADYFLVHDRDIHTGCDDSVVKVLPGTSSVMSVRRSRGYAPSPVEVSFLSSKTVLACGANQKNTFVIGKGNKIFLSQHTGDLENLETLSFYTRNIEYFKTLFDLQPEVMAYDMHPEYLSTKYAKEVLASNVSLVGIPVQHHHAHICSCMADNDLSDRKVIGVAFDGTGYGTDGNIWGAEFLVADYKDFERVAHLKYISLPGGEQAIKAVWRIGTSYLYDTFGKDFLKLGIDFVKNIDLKKWVVLEKMIETNLNCPFASSMGRLFDAVSSICGIRNVVDYEGQAAIELEMQIESGQMANGVGQSYKYGIEKAKKKIYIIDPNPIIKGVVEDLQKEIAVPFISVKFHNTIANMIVEVCEKIRKDVGLDEVVLSGGVFQNVFLLAGAKEKLEKEGFKVYIHRQVPPNDGGISLGQSAIAFHN